MANHDFYSDAFLRGILDRVTSIAMVGASPQEHRPSYYAMKYLRDKGYRMIPVNPGAAGREILGEPVHAALSEIPGPVDMVQVFRNSKAAGPIVDEALSLPTPPPVIWMQLGVRNDEAAERAEAVGCTVVMNRCPKIEWARLNRELGWSGFRTGVISSKKRKLNK